VLAVLGVQLDIAVRAGQRQLAVVLREEAELDDFRVQAALALARELRGLEDLQARRVDAAARDVARVARDRELAACGWEPEVLDQFDAVAKLRVVPQRGVLLARLLEELRERLPRREVVDLDAVELGYRIRHNNWLDQN